MSFGEEKTGRVQQAQETLARFYPEYHTLVHEHQITLWNTVPALAQMLAEVRLVSELPDIYRLTVDQLLELDGFATRRLQGSIPDGHQGDLHDRLIIQGVAPHVHDHRQMRRTGKLWSVPLIGIAACGGGGKQYCKAVSSVVRDSAG